MSGNDFPPPRSLFLPFVFTREVLELIYPRGSPSCPSSPQYSKMATAKQKRDNKPEVPAIIVDSERKAQYERKSFLGKGGFAHCYEFVNRSTREIVAGKVVPKSLLVKQYQRDKMAQEVQIHRDLVHKNVVKLFNFFEDPTNVYVTLELCTRGSLMELHKRRKALTEPEARYFTLQIVEGVLYLHGLNIIHRDLKLGNLFLNEEMQVKIGDFGLATVVEANEMKKTLCGTPNYIAPEVLSKKGHSFEVDVWAMGCILYILLFGVPPFESKSLEETYTRITNNNYKIPITGSIQSSRLIQKMLNSDPAKRPTAKQIHRDIFFQSGYLPTRLPVSCLTMVPKFGPDTQNKPPIGSSHQRRPNQISGPLSDHRAATNNQPPLIRSETTFKEPEDAYLSELSAQISDLLNQKIKYISEEESVLDDYQSPECKPIFWISKWVDYSDKYGIGYQLCDNSIGVLFNDHSRIVLDEAGNELTYIERNNQEHYYCLKNHQVPSGLTKKVTLVKYFRSYMNDHLLAAGEGAKERVGDDLARLPTLRVWFRTKSAIVLHLSNGIVQINFFTDHVKMMICPLMQSVTFIDTQKRMLTYTFANLKVNGCPEKNLQKLRYAEKMIERLINTSGGFTVPDPDGMRDSNNANPTCR